MGNVDLNYGNCESCGTPLDPFNRMHINWHFVCRGCFDEAELADRRSKELVRTIFQYTPQFVTAPEAKD